VFSRSSFILCLTFGNFLAIVFFWVMSASPPKMALCNSITQQQGAKSNARGEVLKRGAVAPASNPKFLSVANPHKLELYLHGRATLPP